MRVGHRLRDLDSIDSGITIGDLLDFVEFADASMAVYRIVNPDWEWTLTNQMLAAQIDFMREKAWAEGGKKGRRPKPIPRPGVSEKTEKQYRSAQASTIEEMDAWLASRVRPK